ncbi:hypothetical protein EVG20_g6349 [Dentipellis fragilis]|uniref:C2H2-type domain-containing protein n=1 Tax=Dentipellis fragilis TaxID=205917 RepID=A0A4Y9YNA7_9AGAM|nr:hypothetical protein EVG20_g6349 [Dentipellis fragilis]
MHPQSITLTKDKFIELSQHTLRPMKCDWEQCPITLNSWHTLKEHIYSHCTRKHKKSAYQCRLSRCSGRSHASRDALFSHIQLSHMTRIPLLCPIRGCPMYGEFARVASLVSHLYMFHAELVNKDIDPASKIFVPLSMLLHHPPQDIPPFTQTEYPLSFILMPPITQKKGAAPAMNGQSSQTSVRKWSQLKKEDAEEEKSEDESISLTFPDFQPSGFKHRKLIHPKDLLIFKHTSAGQEALDLSSPLPVVKKPTIAPNLPCSIGYNLFSLRVAELEHKGILARNGFWPEDQEVQTASPEPGPDRTHAPS